MKRTFFLTNLLVLSVVSISISSTPQIVRHTTQKDFERGKAQGVSVNSRGEVRLAPKLETWHTSDLPFIWAGVSDRAGNFYFAGGSEAKVYKIDARQSSPQEIFSAGDKQIYALALDSRGNLFVATSPEGQVYKVAAGGEPVAFFDPEEIYIWALAVDGEDNLYVATGEQGNLYKVDAGGKASLFYESEEAHIRTLMLDHKGNLVAGTSKEALVLRIDPTGKAFVLYDSPLVEINGLVEDETGNLYVVASGETYLPRPAPRPAAPERAPGEEGGERRQQEEVLELPVQTVTPSGAARAGRQAGQVYRIEPDGTVRQIWSARRERIHAITLDKHGTPLLGTGEPGRIYALTGYREHTLLAELDELQVTYLGRDRNGGILVCTSNSAKVYRFGTGFNAKGAYLSEVVDAKVTSQWGALTWEATVPGGTSLVLYTRTGNSSKPDKTWSPWSAKMTDPAGSPITSPAARFLQYKAEFATKNREKTPVLKEVTLSYLQKNIAPEVTEVKILPPGEFYPESVRNQSSESHVGDNGFGGDNGNTTHPGRKTRRKGGRSVSWKAQDENGDDLLFDVYYKGEDEPNWKLLVKDFRGQLYSWDSELLPDGRYQIKVVARDEPSNPPANVLRAEKLSEPFTVDNTGPRVSNIRVTQTNATGAKISFTVEDALSNVSSVEYTVNAAKWRMLYPVDGIADSREERFVLEVTDLQKGVNTLVIKARDAIGNIGFGRTEITR